MRKKHSLKIERIIIIIQFKIDTISKLILIPKKKGRKDIRRYHIMPIDITDYQSLKDLI